MKSWAQHFPWMHSRGSKPLPPLVSGENPGPDLPDMSVAMLWRHFLLRNAVFGGLGGCRLVNGVCWWLDENGVPQGVVCEAPVRFSSLMSLSMLGVMRASYPSSHVASLSTRCDTFQPRAIGQRGSLMAGTTSPSALPK